ncbi:hypothetical protein MMC18_004491 [Xylographa bjoerkii]|nr:hypothetical protein [Xylographa bjoerkii]
MSAPEKVPFLEFSQDEAALLQERSRFPPYGHESSWKWTWRRALVFQLLLVSCYTAVSITAVRMYAQPKQHSRGLVDLSIQSEPHLYSNLNRNAFAGRPDPQIDASWHQLLNDINIRVSQTELEEMKQSSVSLPEGGGYLSWLGVYHELHCLVRKREADKQTTLQDRPAMDLPGPLFPQPDSRGEEPPGNAFRYTSHPLSSSEAFNHSIDHCIEYLRQAAMCHGDTSLTVFEWDANKSKPMLSPARSPHMCIDWEELRAAVKDRVISHEEFAQLKNPLQENTS